MLFMFITTTARKAGILDNICSHMLICNYSTPQLILHQIIKFLIDPKCSYNNRKIIYPYEIDVYSEKFKLGFEYNGKGWHGEKKESFKRDIIKKKMCLDKHIDLIIIIENNRFYEKDIKNQLIENIDLINDITKLNIIVNDILNYEVNYGDLLMNKNDVKKICLSYDDYDLFRKEQQSLYCKLKNNKLLYNYTKHMKRKINLFWNEESLKKEIEKYEYLDEFIKNSMGAYLYCRKNNLSVLHSHLKRKREASYSDDDIKNIIKNYKYLYDFKKENPKLYISVKHSKKWYLLKDLKRLRKKLNEKLICSFSRF